MSDWERKRERGRGGRRKMCKYAWTSSRTIKTGKLLFEFFLFCLLFILFFFLFPNRNGEPFIEAFYLRVTWKLCPALVISMYGPLGNYCGYGWWRNDAEMSCVRACVRLAVVRACMRRRCQWKTESSGIARKKERKRIPWGPGNDGRCEIREGAPSPSKFSPWLVRFFRYIRFSRRSIRTYYYYRLSFFKRHIPTHFLRKQHENLKTRMILPYKTQTIRIVLYRKSYYIVASQYRGD